MAQAMHYLGLRHSWGHKLVIVAVAGVGHDWVGGQCRPCNSRLVNTEGRMIVGIGRVGPHQLARIWGKGAGTGVDFQAEAHLGQQALNIPTATRRGDDHLPAGRLQLLHRLHRIRRRVQGTDQLFDTLFISAQSRENSVQSLAECDFSVDKLLLTHPGASWVVVLKDQVKEITAGKGAVKVTDEDGHGMAFTFGKNQE